MRLATSAAGAAILQCTVRADDNSRHVVEAVAMPHLPEAWTDADISSCSVGR